MTLYCIVKTHFYQILDISVFQTRVPIHDYRLAQVRRKGTINKQNHFHIIMVSKFYTILFANKYIVIILRVDISIRRHSVKIFLRRNSLRYHTYADYILIQLRVSKQVIYILNPECFALKAEVWSELGGITSLYSLRSPLYPQGTKRYL